MNFEEKAKRNPSMDESQQKIVHDTEDTEKEMVRKETERVINWRRERLLNVLQIYTSPMRKFFLQMLEKQRMN
jgi:hypothetical protein